MTKIWGQVRSSCLENKRQGTSRDGVQGATEIIIAKALDSDSESNQQQRCVGAVSNETFIPMS